MFVSVPATIMISLCLIGDGESVVFNGRWCGIVERWMDVRRWCGFEMPERRTETSCRVKEVAMRGKETKGIKAD